MRRQVRADGDAGFSLIEVIVALFLVGAIAASTIVFFMRGTSTTAHIQRTQAASGVAMQAMEKVRSVRVRPLVDGGTTPLLLGRTRAASEAGFAQVAAIDPSLTAGTNPAWDPAATGSTLPSLPVTTDSTLSNMDYTVTTLIGTCYRAKTASDADCTATDPGGATLAYRAIVVVTWEPGAAKCGGDGCVYSMTSILDPSGDAVWNVSTDPVANDDEFGMTVGSGAQELNVLNNDVIVSVRTNPTTITQAPTQGTATVITSGASMGSIRYTPPANFSGLATLKYRLRDAQGRNSDEGTVVILVYPQANNDSGARVAAGTTARIDVLANDNGTNLYPEIVEQPSTGTAFVNPDGSIALSVPADAPLGNTSFTYRVGTKVVVDGVDNWFWSDNADNSATGGKVATVTVRIGASIPAGDARFEIAGSAANTTTTLDVQSAAGGSTANDVVIVSGPTLVTGTNSARGTLSGSGGRTIRYRQQANTAGVYSFEFQLEDSSGDLSETRVGTIWVTPVANDVTYGNRVTDRNVDITLSGSNVPTASTSGVTYALVPDSVVCTTTSGSGTATPTVTLRNDATGVVRFARGTVSSGWRGTCSVEYTISLTSGGETWTSEPATIFYTDVRR